jgi:hypothetical protein
LIRRLWLITPLAGAASLPSTAAGSDGSSTERQRRLLLNDIRGVFGVVTLLAHRLRRGAPQAGNKRANTLALDPPEPSSSQREKG